MQTQIFYKYAVDFGFRCNNSGTAMQFGLMAPVFLGHWRFEPMAPATQIWESASVNYLHEGLGH
jgi:hypothetical protein